MTELDALIARLLDELRRTLTAGVRAGEPIPDLRRRFNLKLTELGYQETLSLTLQRTIERALNREQRSIERALGDAYIAQRTPSSREPLLALLNEVLGGFTQLAASMEERVISEIQAGIHRDVSQAELTDRLQHQLGVARSVADTWTRTGLAGVNNAAGVVAAQEAGIDRMRYVGASPERRFCRDHIGKVYTIAEIERLDNGQGLSVLRYGGGYRCVHRWRAVIE